MDYRNWHYILESERPIVRRWFQVRSHSILAVGRETSRIHNHVLRLVLQRGFFARCMHWLVSWLPRSLQRLEAVPPAWCLPSNIFLKKLKPDWDDEFANEAIMYAKMKPLQGSVIPICYGEALCDDGGRALVLFDDGGVPFWADQVFAMEEEPPEKMVKEAFTAMASFAVQYDDLKLDNLHLVGDRVVILDLEYAEPLHCSAERAIELEAESIMDLMKYYKRTQKEYRKHAP